MRSGGNPHKYWEKALNIHEKELNIQSKERSVSPKKMRCGNTKNGILKKRIADIIFHFSVQ